MAVWWSHISIGNRKTHQFFARVLFLSLSIISSSLNLLNNCNLVCSSCVQNSQTQWIWLIMAGRSPARGCQIHLPLCITTLAANRQQSKMASHTDKSLGRFSLFLFWCEIPPSSDKTATAAASELISLAQPILSQSLPVYLLPGCFCGF